MENIIDIANDVVQRLVERQFTQRLEGGGGQLGIDFNTKGMSCIMKIKAGYSAETILSSANLSSLMKLVVEDKLLPFLTESAMVTSLIYPALMDRVITGYNIFPHPGRQGVVPPKSTGPILEVDYDDIPQKEAARDLIGQHPWLLITILITMSNIDYIEIIQAYKKRSGGR